MGKPNLPNFLIVGAMKSGTTSLWRYLEQHPQIFMPRLKEPCFLTNSTLVKKRPIRTFEQYIRLFRNAKEETAIGEASPQYLYPYNSTIPNIKKYVGDAKIIIILRNPADRAFSAYKHNLRDKIKSKYREIITFEKCLELEEERKKSQEWTMMHFYKSLGFYYQQVKAYMENFNRVKVCLYNDLSKNALKLVQDIYGFLEVDSSFIPNVSVKYNSSKIGRIKVFQNFLESRKHPLKRVIRPLLFNVVGKNNTLILLNYLKDKNSKSIDVELEPETRIQLIELYRNDILKLQNLIKRDLSDWLC